MKYLNEKRKRKKQKTAHLSGLVAAVILLTGCGSSGAQGLSQNDADAGETTVISLDLTDSTTDENEQRNPVLADDENEQGNPALVNDENEQRNPVLADDENEQGNPALVNDENGSAILTQQETADLQPPEGFELVLNSQDWGLSFGEPGTQPVGNASPEDLAWYDAYFMDDDSEKVIYLTFDCGYENGNTEPILDALKKHQVSATFFVVGHFLETAPELVKRMEEEGHAVGNHTYHHPDMSAISSLDAFQKELDDVAGLFYEITGTELAPYYRPPQGKANAENIRMAQQLGYYTIFWSLAYVDWDTEKQPSHDAALDKLTSRIHPGAIVLLHNTSQTNGEILDELLTKWENMGYSFRPLSALTARRQ